MSRISPPPRPIAIIGPTAVGKSALSIALAHLLDGEIVNADSMQLYQGMDIGTAKLTVEERAGIPHHQLDVIPVTCTASVARYQHDAAADVEAIQARGRVPIIVGGSMLYVQSLIDQWDFPPTDAQVRAKWESRLADVGIHQLHAELAKRDPEAAATIEDQDPRRTVRALEVIELTGKPFKASQPNRRAVPRWNALLVGLFAESEWLNPRIETRTHRMFDRGLIEEVRHLQTKGLVRDSTAGQAIGYAQVLDMFDGQLSEEEAREKTISGTRRYVRRQRAWFKRDPRIHWVEAKNDPLVGVQQLLEQEDS
ncbi:tRNA (adenosine(37)-N6)-dimethylallyltransferase MiaA [Corynebacterium poyangense]|uniref:tRNA dimethylallyltransferase n=1 Tax=Corynebacterium poyangense TaxID=2684405 RepID=A0A7H0SPC3_9CORY|nr:tRNA (adenosine(37)-N6)-dimethylallyltransferase MiaA [Corynebacterium poyangense]MBZ8177975.1 tRNA (adenosine(37)-N6)-dimethylallyltransferase MiaA [Corynebacterium poyangense]QNQ90398.1 tRNA (adenosine(37)-N6)-dimethylallyltransferase MiaA [Corynebacterium poyangense]